MEFDSLSEGIDRYLCVQIIIVIHIIIIIKKTFDINLLGFDVDITYYVNH